MGGKVRDNSIQIQRYDEFLFGDHNGMNGCLIKLTWGIKNIDPVRTQLVWANQSMIQAITKVQSLMHNKHNDFTCFRHHPGRCNCPNRHIGKRFSFIGEGVHRRGLTRCLQQNTVRPSHNRIRMRIQLTPVSCFLLRRCTDCKFLGFSDSDRVCGPSVVVVRGGLGHRKQSFGFWFLAHCCSCHLGKDLLYGMCMATKLITWTLNPWSSHRIVVSTSRIHCRVCTAGKSR